MKNQKSLRLCEESLSSSRLCFFSGFSFMNRQRKRILIWFSHLAKNIMDWRISIGTAVKLSTQKFIIFLERTKLRFQLSNVPANGREYWLQMMQRRSIQIDQMLEQLWCELSPARTIVPPKRISTFDTSSISTSMFRILRMKTNAKKN